jgi:predicted transcriptional regulator
MVNPVAEASAYLDKLEADRQAAIAISEQKAEEAKLIRARLEGFRAALEIFTNAKSTSSCDLPYDKSGKRRPRRDIIQLILRELSFSGQPMTTSQIAKAVDYILERTETALKRLEAGGEVIRNEQGRWTTAVAAGGDKRTLSTVFKKTSINPVALNSAEHSSRHAALSAVENTESTQMKVR